MRTDPLAGHTPWVVRIFRCRRVPAAAVSNGYAVVKVILNDVLPKCLPLKRSMPICDRALVRGDTAEHIDDVIASWRVR